MDGKLEPLSEASFTFIDLFAGIGGMRLGFEAVGGSCVFSSEWDHYAQETYAANFGETPAGDITKISASGIPDHDILLAGFPCQPFSILGNKKGFSDTRGTLFFDIERILEAKTPLAFLLENVKNLRTHDGSRTFTAIRERLKELGYFVHTEILNALDFGLPQKRERVFIAGFRKNLEFKFPKPLGVEPKLADVLETDDQVDPRLFASQRIKDSRLKKCKVKPFYPSVWHENKSGNISALPFSCALRAGASYNYLLVNGTRRPSARELLRLQGFPDTFKIAVPYAQIRKQTGNSVAVPVTQAVAREMLRSLQSDKIARLEPLQHSFFSHYAGH